MRFFFNEMDDTCAPSAPSPVQGGADLRGIRARAYQQQVRDHRVSRIMRKLAFRADADLSVAMGLVSVEKEEERLLRLLT